MLKFPKKKKKKSHDILKPKLQLGYFKKWIVENEGNGFYPVIITVSHKSLLHDLIGKYSEKFEIVETS